MKENLIEKISILLLKNGFTVKSMKSCFDIVARKDVSILLIKVLNDANALLQDAVVEMKRIASYINASPIVIAEKSGNNLEDNIVYSRFGIYTVNFNTFENSLRNKFPFIKSDKGGIKAEIIGRKLKEKRENEGLSLSNLGKKLGVSQRMIFKYENEDSEVSFNRAIKLYEVLGNVFQPINILMEDNEGVFQTHSSDISRKYHNLGFDALETIRSPFDIIAKKEKEIILTRVGDIEDKELSFLAKLLETDNLIIFNRKKPKIETPVIAKEEFLDFEKAKELIKFLKEFS